MMKRKVKRFNEGGDYDSSDDAKNLLAAANREASDAAPKKPMDTAPAEPMKMASFGEAFKEARGRGDKTFEYMGKKYTTEMAGAKKAATPKPASTSPKTGSYGEAAKSSRTLGDVLRGASKSAPDFSKSKAGPEDIKKMFGMDKTESRYNPRRGGNYKAGGSVGSASKRADGCATKGKTRGRMI